MKHRCILSLSARTVSTGLILTLLSCSGLRSHPNVYSSAETRHPNLSLYPGRVSHNLLITDAQLQGGSRKTGKLEHVSPWKVFTGTVILIGSVPIMAAAAYGGMAWAPGLPDVIATTPPAQYTPPQKNGVQVRLSGAEICYRKVPGGGITLARVRGEARIDVKDNFGSYYCRADEIHYRAASNEIILSGRVSVSSTYAPDIHDFGLTRIDLARCTLDYTSKSQKQPSLSKQDSEDLVAVQTRTAYP